MAIKKRVNHYATLAKLVPCSAGQARVTRVTQTQWVPGKKPNSTLLSTCRFSHFPRVWS